ncbi:hypothetical protein E5358_06540 [Palleniella muris]|uniref:Uncharacterized protein n=1 Tax=Palleniella muris TaxID=3038145 RepID=A0AC61QRE4_9BACT|nr:hypothetical protein E5358_06540 [Palleniella muris]
MTGKMFSVVTPIFPFAIIVCFCLLLSFCHSLYKIHAKTTAWQSQHIQPGKHPQCRKRKTGMDFPVANE